jgi:hypothetical protein
LNSINAISYMLSNLSRRYYIPYVLIELEVFVLSCLLNVPYHSPSPTHKPHTYLTRPNKHGTK